MQSARDRKWYSRLSEMHAQTWDCTHVGRLMRIYDVRKGISRKILSAPKADQFDTHTVAFFPHPSNLGKPHEKWSDDQLKAFVFSLGVDALTLFCEPAIASWAMARLKAAGVAGLPEMETLHSECVIMDETNGTAAIGATQWPTVQVE